MNGQDSIMSRDGLIMNRRVCLMTSTDNFHE